MAELIHGAGVVHQSVINSRRCIADGCWKHEHRQSYKIGVGHFGMTGNKVLGDVPFAEEKDDGRDEMGVDVDGLVVEVTPRTE